jgi:ElaB/YqjD/DUF883 family membrane-anchored ribosome-binding protein
MAKRSIFTIEEDSPWDLQLVSKRYVSGKDQVVDVGTDVPPRLNYNEDVEVLDEDSPPTEGAKFPQQGLGDAQPDPQEILWTKPYQGSVHEGVAPPENRPVFDMLSGAELGDGFMKDSSCEVPGMVRHNGTTGDGGFREGLGELPAGGDRAPEVPWIPIRTAWYTTSKLNESNMKRIAREAHLDLKHYDMRQKAIQEGEHTFPAMPGGKARTAHAWLILVEAKTNCLQKHFPAQSRGMSGTNDFFVPAAERDIYGRNYLSGTDDFFVPASERNIYRGALLEGAGVGTMVVPPPSGQSAYSGYYLGYLSTQRSYIKQGLGQLRATAHAVKHSLHGIRHDLKKRLRERYVPVSGLGASAFDAFAFTEFTPRSFTPFQNLSQAMKPRAQGGTAPDLPAFDATKALIDQGLPKPPASLSSLPAFNFSKWELGPEVTADIKTATDEMTKAVTTFTNKSPPWKFSWTEPIGAKNTFSGEDADFVQAMIKTHNKLTSLYTFKEGVTEYVENFKRLFNGSSAMSQLAGSYVQEIVTAMKASLNSFIKSGKASFEVLTTIPKKLMAFMETNAKTLYDTAKAAGDQAMKDMRTYAGDLQTYIKSLVAAIEQDIIGLKNYLVANLTNIQAAIVADATALQQYLVGIFNDFKNWLLANIKSFTDTAKVAVKQLVDEATKAVSDAVSAARAAAEKLVSDLTAKMNATFDKVKADFKATVDKVTKDFNDSYAKLVATLTGTIEVVKKQGELLTGQIKKVTDLKTAYEKFTKETGTRFTNIEAKMAEAAKKGTFATMFSGVKRHLHGLGQLRKWRRRAPAPVNDTSPPMPDYSRREPVVQSFLTTGFKTEVDGFV